MNWKLVGSSASAFILLTTLCVLSFYVGETNISIALNLLVLVFGASLGWAAGTVVSPYTKQEKRQFTALSKAIAAFASGYLVGKLDKLIEKLLDPAFALESVHGFRLLAFVSAFTLAVLFTFVYRQYARFGSKSKDDDDDDDDDDSGEDLKAD